MSQYGSQHVADETRQTCVIQSNIGCKHTHGLNEIIGLQFGENKWNDTYTAFWWLADCVCSACACLTWRGTLVQGYTCCPPRSSPSPCADSSRWAGEERWSPAWAAGRRRAWKSGWSGCTSRWAEPQLRTETERFVLFYPFFTFHSQHIFTYIGLIQDRSPLWIDCPLQSSLHSREH